jgi:hypothetical protein
MRMRGQGRHKGVLAPLSIVAAVPLMPFTFFASFAGRAVAAP